MRALLAAVTAGALALSGATAALATPSAPGAAAAAPAVAPTLVTLVTGDRVLVSGDRVLALPGGSADLHVVRAGTHTYVLPRAARPYVGALLDLSLFDVAALAAQPGGGRLAVTLGLRPGSTPSVPGLTVTARTATSASGYLTASSARDLGRALEAQRQRDERAGWPATGELFGGVTALRRASAAPVATPDFPQVTLTLKVLDGAGRPAAFGEVALVDVDDARRYVGFPLVVDGLARVSVPLGHYSALSVTEDAGGATTPGAQRVVPLPDAEVTGPGQTLVLDGRTATVSPSVRTPRPADVRTSTVEWDRSDAAGRGSLSFSLGSGGGGTLLVAPAPAARHGDMHWVESWSLMGTSTSDPYTYDLVWTSRDVPGDQSHVVRDGDLSTLQSRYHGTTGHTSGYVRLPVQPFQFFSLGFLDTLRTPAVRTEYARSAAGTLWTADLLDDLDAPALTFVGDGLRAYAPATGYRAAWLRPVLGTGLPEATDPSAPAYCAACRDGDVLSLSLAPLLDSTPGHVGVVLTGQGQRQATRLRVLRGDTVVVDRRGALGARWVAPETPVRYRVLAESDRPVSGRTSSSVTELTFSTARGAGPALPDSWECLGPQRATCRALPLLQARAELPVDLHDTLPVGTSTAVLTVGHAPGAGSPAVTSALLETSRDGVTWQAQPTTRLADGRYRVELTDPAAWAGAAVSVRLTAEDAAGATLRQTIGSAYLVAGR